MFMQLQVWLAVLAGLLLLTVGAGSGSLITYWIVERRQQDRELRQVDWLKWHNENLEGILERKLSEEKQEGAGR